MDMNNDNYSDPMFIMTSVFLPWNTFKVQVLFEAWNITEGVRVYVCVCVLYSN